MKINLSQYLNNCVIRYNGQLAQYAVLYTLSGKKINVCESILQHYGSALDPEIKAVYESNGFEASLAGVFVGCDVSNPDPFSKYCTLYGVQLKKGHETFQVWLISPYFKIDEHYVHDQSLEHNQIKLDGYTFHGMKKKCDLSNDPLFALRMRKEFLALGLTNEQISKISVWDVYDSNKNPWSYFALGFTCIVVQDWKVLTDKFQVTIDSTLA
ncbi:MAG: hypothetical protein ACRCXZ_00330 [Patescibacteria group bacterium]